ncbi:uncharacterized protein FA14DRAFT_181083 [Meira miltonrushii]|uniref:Peroxin-3 n=1 Tax=Meira miltonrushii TaxID=1280837 RepID=A0A316VG54_9BASI|nr:uncharacterized protein FA14DRAFT_181083 [Meira miltonrushii]PWN34465.1 hypothetical protein FA14DRAFT_181083 [Meira miltonrushii]
MTSYLQSTRDFLYRRRKPFIVVGTLVGGVYMVANYAVSKISDMQNRMVEERRDKENLRRRFNQNQEDCTYTVQALLPTLGDQLFAYMDVEGLTAKLQQGRQVASEPQTPAPKTNGSIPHKESQVTTEEGESTPEKDGLPSKVQEQISEGDPTSSRQEGAESTQSAETSGKETVSTSDTAMEQAWNNAVPRASLSGLDSVAEPSPQPIASEARLTPSPQPSTPVLTNTTDPVQEHVPESIAETQPKVEPEESKSNHEVAQESAAESKESLLKEKRAKLALWNELKIASISRTITTLYGIVLLSLQTRVQLNLLGRYAYLTSVTSLSASDESAKHHIRIERNDGFEDLDEDGEEEREENTQSTIANSDVLTNGIDLQTEKIYLTLSWWFLHRGWQELADIVRSAVEEVFGDLPLKAQLSHAEFISLIQKVRRRVEYEPHSTDGQSHLGTSFASLDVRSEYSEATTTMTSARRRGKRRDFSSILFPPQGQELQVLIDAGALPQSSKVGTVGNLQSLSNTLPALLDETRDLVESNDFWRVLKLGLRESFGIFEHNLRPSFGLEASHPKAPLPPPPEASITELPPSADPPLPPKINGGHSTGDVQEEGKSIRLASLFPVVARQSSAAINGFPNEYMDALNNVKELRAFCAVIYSSWS